jgi:hypothetical protein
MVETNFQASAHAVGGKLLPAALQLHPTGWWMSDKL